MFLWFLSFRISNYFIAYLIHLFEYFKKKFSCVFICIYFRKSCGKYYVKPFNIIKYDVESSTNTTVNGSFKTFTSQKLYLNTTLLKSGQVSANVDNQVLPRSLKMKQKLGE